MVGVIHKVLFEMLTQLGGHELVGRINQRAGIDLADIRIIDSQPDSDFADLIQIVIEETGITRPQLIDSYAISFLEYAEGLFPEFFRMSANAREFLIRQPKIHSTLGAGLESDREKTRLRQKFIVVECADGSIEVSYESAAGLCDLYQSLAHHVARRFGDKLNIAVKHCGQGSGCGLHLIFNSDELAASHQNCEWIAAQ